MADYIYYVTVSGGAFLIDGESQAELGLKAGLTYRFDVSDASCASQTFKFSTTSDGTHGGGSEYTTNVTVTGTAGSSGAVVDLVVPSSTGTLYYYNGAASGYGGTIRYTTDTYVSTTNLGLKVPLPGASDDVWASHLNASLRTIDSATGNISITGGTIDGTTIGGTTPAAGTFTTFTSTGIDDNLPSGGPALTIDNSGNVQLSNSLTAGTLGSGVTFPAGHVIQIVQAASDSTNRSTTSLSFVTAYSTASITPTSTSSKILATVYCNVDLDAGQNAHFITLFRNGSTNLGYGSSTCLDRLHNVGAGRFLISSFVSILDSPSTTSSTSYTLYHSVQTSTTGTIRNDLVPAQITLYEIAG